MKKHFKQLCFDLIGLTGLGFVSYGAHHIYEPAAPIVAGAFLMLLSWKASKNNGEEG